MIYPSIRIEGAILSPARAFEKALSDRHTAITSAMTSGEWGQIVVLPISPAARLQALADKLNNEAETLEKLSSLDHKRRERVARRLAAEGTKRQVIIFTHNLYFMNLLIEEAQQAGVAIETQSISRHPAGFGVADPDLPFEGMNTKARVGYLKNRHPQIKKLFESGDELEHRKQTADAYRELRIAWERAIEEVLLRNVVLRFRKGIETQRLAGVLVEDADYVAVDTWMSKCSNYAHDQALLGGVEVPEPDELLGDIIALDDWRKETDKRSEAVQKKRKSGV